MRVHIHIHKHEENSNNHFVTLKLNKIMAEVQKLRDEVADLKAQQVELQNSIDLEQAQIQALFDLNAEVVQGLNDQIAALQEQLANSASPEEVQEVIDGLEEVKASIALSKADIESTVEDSTTTSSTTETTTEESTTSSTTESPEPIL